MPDYVRQEISTALQEELGRYGNGGLVRIEGSTVSLQQGDINLSCPIGNWANSWPRLDEDSRRKCVSTLARSLSRARPLRPSGRASRRLEIDRSFLYVGAAVLIAFLYYLTLGRTSEGPSSRISSNSDSATRQGAAQTALASESQDARAIRVCAATMNRVFQGGSVTVADADGWRVEIALLGPPGAKATSAKEVLSRYVEDPSKREGSRFRWKDEPGLASIETSDTLVQVRGIESAAANNTAWSIVLSFGGTLVDPYFSESGRSRFYHIAHNLSEELGAANVAVYGRCSDTSIHAIGSWFRGRDAAGAAASLIFFMGMYASPSHLSASHYGATQPGEAPRLDIALSSITRGTAAVDRQILANIVGSEGGMALGKSDEAVTITFPFSDGNRASRASRSLTRLTGLAP